mmetsp:Transcript_71315/g.172187  ORF Transcript_71315/g.172187 Transcript_71315/m.172187 type:complete len:469 (+) Transcript_71315:174-1580(+)
MYLQAMHRGQRRRLALRWVAPLRQYLADHVLRVVRWVLLAVAPVAFTVARALIAVGAAGRALASCTLGAEQLDLLCEGGLATRAVRRSLHRRRRRCLGLQTAWLLFARYRCRRRLRLGASVSASTGGVCARAHGGLGGELRRRVRGGASAPPLARRRLLLDQLEVPDGPVEPAVGLYLSQHPGEATTLGADPPQLDLRVERGGEQQVLALDVVEAGDGLVVRAPVVQLLDVVTLLDAAHVDEVGDAPHLDEARRVAREEQLVGSVRRERHHRLPGGVARVLLPHALAIALDVPEAEHAVGPRAAERLGAAVEEDELVDGTLVDLHGLDSGDGQRELDNAGVHIPHEHAPVVARGGEQVATSLRGVGDREDVLAVARHAPVRADEGIRLLVVAPHDHLAVPPSGDDELVLTLDDELDARHLGAALVAQLLEQLAVTKVPHAHGPVVAARDEAPSRFVKGHGGHLGGVEV